MTSAAPARLLTWDSEFFGCRVARVTGSTLTAAAVPELMSWCQNTSIDCMYLLADPSCPLTPRVASDSGFRLVDVRVTLSQEVDGSVTPAPGGRQRQVVRVWQESDVVTLRGLARTSHRDSRFYFDGHFDRQLCDLLFETWIERSCRGWARTVLVGVVDGEVAGYLTCHVDDPARGRIGLIAVAPAYRGVGLGRLLISSARAWFVASGCRVVDVVTQGRNVAAQRLYQACGFRTSALDLWFHWWSPDASASGRFGRPA